MADLPRIQLIDYIRGLAALSVAWFHMTSGSDGWLQETGRFGFLGVEAFFVISGLVIPYSIKRFINTEVEYFALALVALVVSLLAAVLMYQLIERPFQMLSRTIGRVHRQTARAYQP